MNNTNFEQKEEGCLDSIQVYVDKIAGWLLIVFGFFYLLLLLFSIFYFYRYGKNPYIVISISVYSFVMLLISIRKGKILIKKAGTPAYTFVGDKHFWKARLVMATMLIIFTLILISGVAQELSLILGVSLIPLLIILL